MKRRGAIVLGCALVALALPVRADDATGSAADAPTADPLKKPVSKLDPATLPAYGLSIIAKRKTDARIAGSAHVVDEKKLEEFEHDDIQRVLKDVPGVYVREEDGFGLRPNIGLRGASSDRSAKVTLMEDGILFGPAPYSAPAAYFFPMSTRLTGVEVFKGPASIRSGPNTVGGALNLLTRPIPTTASGGIDLAAGLYSSGKAHAYGGTTVGPVGVLLEGVRLQSDGFKQLDGGGDTGFDKNELMLKTSLAGAAAPSGAHRLELKLGYSDESSRETYLGLSDADFAANPWRRYAASRDDLMSWWRTQAELAHTFSLGTAFEVRTVAYRHDFVRTWRKLNRFRGGPDLVDILKSPAKGQNGVYQAILGGREDTETADQALMIGTNDRRFVSQGVQSTGHFDTKAGDVAHNLQFGLRLHADEIDRVHTEKGYDMRAGKLVAEDAPIETTVKNTGSTLAFAAHVLDEIDLGSVLVTPGARLELISMRLVDARAGTTGERLDAVVLPGIGAAWQVNRWLTLLGGIHRGFSPVSPGQAPDVQPESSINGEAGTRIAARHARVELIGFYNRYSNLTAECTASGGCSDVQMNTQFNGGAVDVFGLEASAGAEHTLAQALELRGTVSYTATLSRFRSDFTSDFPQFGSVSAGDSLPYVPVHQASALLALKGAGWELAASGAFVGAMRDRAGQGDMKPADWTDAQFIVDVVGNYALDPANHLYLKADNLLDAAFIASRRPFGVRPAQPLLVMAGYKHLFGVAE